MRRVAVRWLRNGAGVVLILLGIVSGFLPILQGWLFIVVGLGLIEHPLKHRLHEWLARRFKLYRRIAILFFRAKRRLRRRRVTPGAAPREPGSRPPAGSSRRPSRE